MEEQKNVALTAGMTLRLDMMTQAAVNFCNVLIDDAKACFRSGESRTGTEVVDQVLESSIQILQEHGFPVCRPYLEEREGYRKRRCTLMDCKCSQCNYQDKQEERERLFDAIEQALTMSGYQILDGNRDKMIVRNRITQEVMSVKVLDEA